MHLPWFTFNDVPGRIFPAHESMGEDYDYDAPNSVRKLPGDRLPTFEPNFRTVKIHSVANRYDLLSSATFPPVGFLVSDRLRQVLQQFTLPLHRFYPAPAIHRKKHLPGYNWFQLPEANLPLLDTMSFAEAEAVIQADPTVAELDMVRIRVPLRFSYCFVSRRLRTAIEQAEVTGVRFGTAKLFRTAPK